MTLNMRQLGAVSVLVPNGRIGPIEMGQLKHILKKLLALGKKRVLVNLEYVPEMSWSAIGALAEKSNEFRSQKGEFKVAGLNESLSGTFQAVGAHRAMDLYDCESTALKSFRSAR